jgi:hypothetical protein
LPVLPSDTIVRPVLYGQNSGQAICSGMSTDWARVGAGRVAGRTVPASP